MKIAKSMHVPLLTLLAVCLGCSGGSENTTTTSREDLQVFLEEHPEFTENGDSGEPTELSLER